MSPSIRFGCCLETGMGATGISAVPGELVDCDVEEDAGAGAGVGVFWANKESGSNANTKIQLLILFDFLLEGLISRTRAPPCAQYREGRNSPQPYAGASAYSKLRLPGFLRMCEDVTPQQPRRHQKHLFVDDSVSRMASPRILDLPGRLRRLLISDCR